MNAATPKPKADKNTTISKVEKIQEIYGKDKTGATLEQTSDYLKKRGFKALADLLMPAKEITKQDFDAVLKKVARKIKPKNNCVVNKAYHPIEPS